MQINEGDSLVGMKFNPSDQLLVGYHLYKKVTNKEPLDLETIIQECDLYGEKEPWEIWETYGGNGLKPKEDLYFFTRLKKKTLNGKRINRTIGSGTWKGEDSGKPIFVCGFEKPMGFKKLFRYESGSQQNGGWILHEYSLDSWVLQQKQVTYSMQADEYVLCRMRNNSTERKRCAEGALKRDAYSKRFKVEEAPVRVEELNKGTTVLEQVAEYGLGIRELGDHSGNLSNPDVLPIEPVGVGVSKHTMVTTVSQRDNIDGLEIGELSDNNGSLSKDMRSEEVLSMFELIMARSDELQQGDEVHESHVLDNLRLDEEFQIESIEMSELTMGQVADGQTNIGESGGCSGSPCKYSSVEEVPTLKTSGSNTSTTTVQQGYGDLWEIPWDDKYLGPEPNA